MRKAERCLCFEKWPSWQCHSLAKLRSSLNWQQRDFNSNTPENDSHPFNLILKIYVFFLIYRQWDRQCVISTSTALEKKQTFYYHRRSNSIALSSKIESKVWHKSMQIYFESSEKIKLKESVKTDFKLCNLANNRLHWISLSSISRCCYYFIFHIHYYCPLIDRVLNFILIGVNFICWIINAIFEWIL